MFVLRGYMTWELLSRIALERSTSLFGGEPAFWSFFQKSLGLFFTVQWISEKNHLPTSYFLYELWLATNWEQDSKKEIYLNISFQSYISTLCLLSPYLGNLLEHIPPVLCLKRQLPVWGKEEQSHSSTFRLRNNPPLFSPCLTGSTDSFWHF